jgi:hypothetical protein
MWKDRKMPLILVLWGVTKQAQNAGVFDLRFTLYGMLCTTCKLQTHRLGTI